MVKKIIMVMVVSLITILTMRGLYAYGIEERGFPAIGGEVLIPVIPIVGAAIMHDKKRNGICFSINSQLRKSGKTRTQKEETVGKQ